MGNGKIWPSADAKPLNRSSPNLKHGITLGISSSKKNLGLIRPGDFAPHIPEIYTQNLRMFTSFFPSSSESLQTRSLDRFSRLIRHTTCFCARKCLLGWEKLISKFDRFIRKIWKIYNGAYGEILKKILNCHNSGCMQERVVIFDSRVGFSGTGYLMALFKLTPGLPLLPWQRNLGQNRL